MSTTALPSQPAAASKAALDAAIKDSEASSSSSQTADSANAAASTEPSSSNGAADADDSLAADESVRTVFDDKEDFNVKHPLFNVWTLWFDNPSHKAVSTNSRAF